MFRALPRRSWSIQPRAVPLSSLPPWKAENAAPAADSGFSPPLNWVPSPHRMQNMHQKRSLRRLGKTHPGPVFSPEHDAAPHRARIRSTTR